PGRAGAVRLPAAEHLPCRRERRAGTEIGTRFSVFLSTFTTCRIIGSNDNGAGWGMSASKIFASFDDAVRDIADGATIGFGGFAVVGMPINLYEAAAKQGAKNLTCVSNSTRGGATLPADAPDMGGLIKNGQVKKVICAFTAPTRASQRLILTQI